MLWSGTLRHLPVGAERLGRALERERLIDPAEVNSISHAIHGMIAEIAGNRFLHFCIEVLTQLTSVNVDRSRVSTDLVKVQDEVNLIHSRIVKAIVHSDADRAAALMGGISRRSRDSSRFDVGASMPRTAEVHLLEVSDRHRVDGPCDELVVPPRHRNLIVRGDSGGRVAGAGR